MTRPDTITLAFLVSSECICDRKQGNHKRGTILRLTFTALIAAAALASCGPAEEELVNETTSVTETATDPYLWLEEVEGEDALAWVESQNARSLEELKAHPAYAGLEAAALEVATSQERIPYGQVRDGMVYNFWQDATHVRGIWRRTPLESYKTDEPEWETVLDFDKLAADEDANWVFKGSNCFKPQGGDNWHCMISLSNGGKDAVIQREFDMASKTFIDGGFVTDEAKQGLAWIDADTMLVGTDWGGDGSTLTESGYPSVVKRWTRGTPLSEAVEVMSGDKAFVGVWPFALELEDETRLEAVVASETFFTSSIHLIKEDGTPEKMPIPAMSDIEGLYKGQMMISLKEDWSPEGQDESFKTGDLVSFNMAAYLENYELPEVSLIFRPNDRQAVNGVAISKDISLLSINDNVVGRIMRLDYVDGSWTTEDVPLPGTGQAGIAFASDKEDAVFLNYEGFLTPDSLLSYDVASNTVAPMKSLPAKFDAEGLTVQQFEAKSADGTMIPYFVVHRSDIELDGSTPTLLYGYGGFEISLNPSYSVISGKLWLERGGAYVLANIRGGGEFGPKWHQAGLKLNRQRIYDDFIAVGEDVIAKKITSPEHLGIMGGSNGGLLMGVMLNQRPDLWNAVVVQVPLLDMLRYHKLLAGASWVGEYGDPDIPEERAFLETISPYQNFDAEADYPTPFFVTSTKDDRVHPGHARKMAKLFEEAGKPFLYYENTDGGHAAAADQTARAKRSALEYTYLTERLMGE